MKKTLFILCTLFATSLFAQTKIHCFEKDRDLVSIIELDLVKAIRTDSVDFMDNLAKITTYRKDVPSAISYVTDLALEKAQCFDCYLVLVESINKNKVFVNSRYALEAKINIMETAPVQLDVKILNAYKFDKRYERNFKPISCQAVKE